MFRRRNKREYVPSVPPVIPHNHVDYGCHFVMPSEEEPHEGTWITWPHNYGWDKDHVQRYEPSWIALTKALHTGERVHIIAYNNQERDRIQHRLLQEDEDEEGIDISQIDFYVWPTDDVWIRDYGPIFVYRRMKQLQQHPTKGDDDNIHVQNEQELCITNWLFNGWGGKAEDYYDNYIPLKIGHVLNGMPVIDIPMVNEGGSIEIDGRGTLMAKKSSILNSNRNKGWKQADAEAYFRHYLGVTNFIWLDGKKGSDITDDHIDGTARFASRGETNIIVTFNKEDFVNQREYKVLQNAVDVNGDHYTIEHLPCTKHKLKNGIGDYGIYINYYVGNKVVLVPAFDDPNDQVAADILQRIYHPHRNVVSIPFLEVYRDGGIIHCVTQQQPLPPTRREHE